jgi:hypothetical protein
MQGVELRKYHAALLAVRPLFLDESALRTVHVDELRAIEATSPFNTHLESAGIESFFTK